ncbi:helix-turn-helix domain-containing protein [Spirosoma radiotolerans]|uniref:AraC family transcriptional regulator n=1 Tax=Spirosoma radiotolerans TaxID=1379870 RepID=A0A0E3V7T0_9BACT|nr:AraC family transcriptional regulator [Spirosoma radiotolerans]AKD55711.1 AraC family transcriptional regulator [Spirosoma radiotolerans]
MRQTGKVVKNEAVSAWGNRLDTLVENKLTLSHDSAELHLYETFQQAHLIQLRFNAPVMTSMLSGRKVMHLREMEPFNYQPGESLLLPSDRLMQIDFPDATTDEPTRCLALTISDEFIRETIAELNEQVPRVETANEWQLDVENYLLQNDPEISSLTDKLIRLFRENNPFKPFFIKNTLRELIVRLSQTQVRTGLLQQTSQHINTNRLAYVVTYIRENLTRALSVEDLSDKACLSKSHFFRLFKSELGVSPAQFILSERIQLSKAILSNPTKTISDACYESGFNSLTHFSNAFRSIEHICPRQFKRQLFGLN